MPLTTILSYSANDMLNDFTIYNDNIYSLLIRMGINLLMLTILVRYIYFPITKRRDFLFTYYMVGMIAFFLCFSLKKLNIDTGMGLSLFAIFGIIRYRTDTIEIKEMTYLFLIIGVSVFNSLASSEVSAIELFTINFTVVALTLLFEKISWSTTEKTKMITYERIELIKPENEAAMLADLQSRTGLKITRFEIGKIDFLQDTSLVKIYYHD